MKIITWNVNGLKAALNKGISTFLLKEDPDIIAIQETKTSVIPLPEFCDYHAVFSFNEKAPRNFGTLVLSKARPLRISRTLPGVSSEGRIITIKYSDFYFINAYYPNPLYRVGVLDYRAEWDEAMFKYLQNLRCLNPVIIAGDFNTTAEEIDIYPENEKGHRENKYFMAPERENLHQLLHNGFTDSFRQLHPEEKDCYTWWTNRRNYRKTNQGWRLDYILVSSEIDSRIKSAEICPEATGSDHCPCSLEIDYGIDFGHKLRPLNIAKHDKLPGILENLSEDSDLGKIWDNNDWEKCEKNLADLQRDMTHACFNHDWSNAKAIYRKITKSLDAKMLAVRHVSSSKGFLGIDGKKWKTSDEKMRAALALNSKGFVATPAVMNIMLTKTGKVRRISSLTCFDSAMQCLHAYALDPFSEATADKRSFAFRKGRSTLDPHPFIIDSLSKPNSPKWLFIGDISQCYESISHEWVLRNINVVNKSVLKAFLKSGYILAGDLFSTEDGVGLGCTLSPIIANMTLDRLQSHIYKNLPDHKDDDYLDGGMIRYADDIIVTARSYETASRIRDLVIDFLRPRGLQLNYNKSRIIHISEGFTFLSRTYKMLPSGYLFAAPSHEAVDRIKSTLIDAITNHTGSIKRLIEKLNKTIYGWRNFHHIEDAEETFRALDAFLAIKLLEHFHRRRGWKIQAVAAHYWIKRPDGKHIFRDPKYPAKRLVLFSDAIMITKKKIRVTANPYLTFETKEDKEKKEISTCSGKYKAVFTREQERCWYCGQKILRDQERTVKEEFDAPRKSARLVYVHTKCAFRSVNYVPVEYFPEIESDLEDMLSRKQGKFAPLSDYFRKLKDPSVILTFKDIEKIIKVPLAKSSKNHEYWYRTGEKGISDSWKRNGYDIRRLDIENKTIVFYQTERHSTSVPIPDWAYGKIPEKAAYDLKKAYEDIQKRYGL